MSDDQVFTPVGGDSAAPVGGSDSQISPDQLNRPIRPDQASAEFVDPAVAQQLGLVKAKNQELQSEKRKLVEDLKGLRQQMEQLQAAQQSTVQRSLEEQGQFKQLYEDLKKTHAAEVAAHAETKGLLEQERQGRQQETLKAAATAQISQANAVNPSQLYALLQPQLRADAEGNPVALFGGVETPLADALASLKQAPEWQHHFGPAAGGYGMGAAPTSSVAPGMNNPFRSGNLTEAMALKLSNPELAAALEAEARRG
jgi:hypothetical protein